MGNCSTHGKLDVLPSASKYQHQLNERKKELHCIYYICDKQQKLELNLRSALLDIIDIIIVSWQYPAITCAKIQFKDLTVRSTNYKSTPWQQLGHKNDLSITVGYLKKMPNDQDGGEGPFLVEERHLLDGICTIVNDFLSMRKTRLEMKERCKELNCLYKISHLMLQNDLSIELFCNEIVNDVVPTSFQYPNQCAVQLRIQLPSNDNSDKGEGGENTLVFSNQVYKDYELMASMKSPIALPQSLSATPGYGLARKTLKEGVVEKEDDKSQKRRGSKNVKVRQGTINKIFIGTLEVGYVDGATKDLMFLQEEQQLLHAIASQVGSCVSKFTREQLVHSMLPPNVALELQLHQKVAPQTFETISILFTDIVGFTVISCAAKRTRR